VYPDGQIERAVDPAELGVQQELRHVQDDLGQEEGGQHDAEQDLAAREIKTAKTVGGHAGGDHGADDLGQNIAVGVEHGLQDVDGTAKVVQRVLIALEGGVLDPQADACKDLAVVLKGGADHPQQGIDHDEAHQDQDEVLEKRRDGVRSFHSHTVTPYLSSE